jgi:sigma-E factor negative regulatory protein RseB
MQRATFRSSLGLCLAATVIAGTAAIWAWPARAGDVNAFAAADARGWLQRMHAAASQRNYQGTLVVTASGSMSSSRLAHYCEGSQSFERIDMLDGQPRRVYRHNEQLLTLWPALKLARTEQREAVAVFPAVLSGSIEQLFERYDMVAEGGDRVAGLETAVFLLRPRDDLRFAQRLWAERDSGLLLRADVLALDGHVLETAAFSEITIDIKPQPDSVRAPMKKLDGYRVLHSAPKRTALEAEGWRLVAPVSGFKQISCVKRSLEASGDVGHAAAPDVLQAIYSDGLTHVSVFIEPLRGGHQHAGAASVGATQSLMQPIGSHWVTVMGDVPTATLKQFAAALERLR